MYYDPVQTGVRIRNLRKSANCTQEQLAEKLNVSCYHLQSIEVGRRSCSVDLLLDLALLFHVSLDYLVIGYSENMANIRAELKKAILYLEEIESTIGY